MKEASKELKALITALSSAVGIAEPASESSATGGLSPAQMVSGLKQLFRDQIHVVDPTLSLQHSPITPGPAQGSAILQYVQAIQKLCSTPSSQALPPGKIHLSKPLVMMLATKKVEGSGSVGAITPIAWKTLIIVPSNYQPPLADAPLAQPPGLLGGYYFDTEAKSLPNQVPGEVGVFCAALTQGFRTQVMVQGRPMVAQVAPVLPPIALSNGSRALSVKTSDTSWWAVYFAVMAIAKSGWNFDDERPASLTAARLQHLYESSLSIPAVSSPLSPGRIEEVKSPLKPKASEDKAPAVRERKQKDAASSLAASIVVPDEALLLSQLEKHEPSTALLALKSILVASPAEVKTPKADVIPESVPILQSPQMLRCLTQLFTDSIHLIDPALSLKASPLLAGPAQGAGVFQYMQAIRQICTNKEDKADKVASGKPLSLLKPVVLLLATPDALLGAVLWKAVVIIPQNYFPPLADKPLGNSENHIVYYFDPSTRQAPHQIAANVLRFIQALSQGCQVPAIVNGQQGVLQVKPLFSTLGFFNGSRRQCREASESAWWALYFAVMAVATGRYNIDELHPSGISLAQVLPLLQPLTLEKPATPKLEGVAPVPALTTAAEISLGAASAAEASSRTVEMPVLAAPSAVVLPSEPEPVVVAKKEGVPEQREIPPAPSSALAELSLTSSSPSLASSRASGLSEAGLQGLLAQSLPANAGEKEKPAQQQKEKAAEEHSSADDELEDQSQGRCVLQ